MTLGTLRLIAGMIAQIGKALPTMAAPAGENIAAQSAKWVAIRGVDFKPLRLVRYGMRFKFLVFWAALMSSVLAADLSFIDTSIENGSPLWYDFAEDGTIRVHLIYDLERDSPNRAAGHIHFRAEGKPGAKLRFEFLNLDNVWNSTPGSVARELKTMVVSENGRDWKSIPLKSIATNRVQLEVEMRGSSLYIAREEPYRLSDLENFLRRIRSKVEITEIGKTVEGRPLEIIRLGKESAPHRVFLRARAHPWESGGNWIVEGLVDRLLREKQFLESYSVYILPMANKDGVARGRTRFNLRGKDLNRNWDKPADPELVPENAALERWLEKMIARKKAPELAIELHNDGNGLLHISRPPVAGVEAHVDRMKKLEALLRKHTWFTEGVTSPSFRNSGTLGEGWLLRYGIDAVVHEFNCNWIEGVKDYPSAKYWKHYGEGLALVFRDYFAETK
jgi:hypothetical protein